MFRVFQHVLAQEGQGNFLAVLFLVSDGYHTAYTPEHQRLIFTVSAKKPGRMTEGIWVLLSIEG
jgi:hypothetical protein